MLIYNAAELKEVADDTYTIDEEFAAQTVNTLCYNASLLGEYSLVVAVLATETTQPEVDAVQAELEAEGFIVTQDYIEDPVGSGTYYYTLDVDWS